MMPQMFDENRLYQQRLWAKKHFESTLYRATTQRMLARLDPLTIPFRQILDLSPLHTPGMEKTLKKKYPKAHILHDSGYAFGDNTFDLILSPLELHWSNNPLAYLSAIFDALKPGGLFVASFLGGNTLIELRHVLAELDFETFGRVNPRVIPFIKLEDTLALLKAIPFRLPAADIDTLTFCYQNVTQLCKHLGRMGEGNALCGPSQQFTPITFWHKADALYRAYYEKKDTSQSTPKPPTLPATFSLITLVGWKNGPDLPKPLEPKQKWGHAAHDNP